ncbi:hypothetical protein [Cognataquiflexum rubidum]|uniref:hypothetical protein n=1 Tax=Cognataquiflexum rubidum TaxID=2922273 RepID=UPI001F146E53|nr:hypothetical protein [Cognataquiflexum rubidum]MCH6234921.1 hypothetical protein [Cognataquiflexum rubidum]
MIRFCFMVIVSVLVLGNISKSEAQMVSVRLVLPAGVNFNPRIVLPQTIGGQDGMRWVEMVVQENIQVTVNLKSDFSGKDANETLYIVNNGTSDFGSALQFESGKANFQMNSKGMLIRNIKPDIQQVRAWIGIPILPGIKTTIEYH